MPRSVNARANAMTATIEIGTPSEDGDSPPTYQRKPFHPFMVRLAHAHADKIKATIVLGSSSDEVEGGVEKDNDMKMSALEPDSAYGKLQSRHCRPKTPTSDGMC